MKILTQDKDEIFTLSDMGLFQGQIYIEVKYFQGQLMGCNVMGKRLFRETILGTYDEEDAQQVVQEIYKLLRAGEHYYSMPEAALEMDEMGVEL